MIKGSSDAQQSTTFFLQRRRQSLLTLYRQEANASDLTCSPMPFKGQKPFPRPWASSYATLLSALSMSTGG